MRARLSLLCVSLAASAALAQAPKYGCDSPESKQLDFWVGEWDLSYAGGGKGRNRITKALDGCAVFEEFEGAPGTPLNGRSFSVFDRTTKLWKQTWVDNTGAYLDFVGELVDGQVSFRREGERAGRKILTRMIWSDVKADSLKWLWQSSGDGGKTWKTTWEIDYRRIR